MSAGFGFIERADCPGCGSGENRTLLSVNFSDARVFSFLESFYYGALKRDDFTAVPYEISRCVTCSLVWQKYILDERGMLLLYEEWISVEDSLGKKQHGDVALFFQYAEEMQAICNLLAAKPSQLDVLDFGMGWGYWCRMAVAFNFKVFGYELSEQRKEFAEKNGIEVLAQFDDLRQGQFDFINCEQVIEHLASPLTVVKALQEGLKEGGVIRLSVPNGSLMVDELQKEDWTAAKDPLHPLEHVNCFSHESLVALAENAGLELINAENPLAGSHATCLYFRKREQGRASGGCLEV